MPFSKFILKSRLAIWGTIELEKAVAGVTDAEVDRTIDILRKRQAHFHVKGEDSEHGKGNGSVVAEDGDRVTIDFTGRIDGVEFNSKAAKRKTSPLSSAKNRCCRNSRMLSGV